MFNTHYLDKAKEDFNSQRFCVIDDIIKEPWILDLYKCLPTMNMGYWMCAGHKHQKISQEKAETIDLAGYKS